MEVNETLESLKDIHYRYINIINNIKDKEISGEIVDFLNEVEFARNFLRKDRPRARDLPRDSKGRIIVDVTRPHILENTDYFRQPAIYFQKYGRYCDYTPTKLKDSDYVKFWREQRRRCLEGYVREEDGEWVTGYHYWYLNFCPIELTREIGDKKSGRVKAERIVSFPKFWDGDYLFFHYLEQCEEEGLFANVLKTRARGFSYKGASIGARNFYLIPKSKSYYLASEGEYLTRGGVLEKLADYLSHIDSHTPFKKLRQKKDTMMHRRASYIDTENNIEKGIKSEVIGVSVKDNVDKIRGKRGKVFIHEETGKYPGYRKAWNIIRPSVEQGRSVYGLQLGFGTGGSKDSDFADAEAMFYNPYAYKIKPLRNVFDRNVSNSECSFFSPEYLNREGFYDEDGNSDVLGALIEYFKELKTLKQTNPDPQTILQFKAENCITPQDACMKTSRSIFPTAYIKERLGEIIPNLNSFVSSHYVGDLEMTNDGVKWSNAEDVRVIREYPLNESYCKEGGIEIFEMPASFDNKKIPYGRYIAGMDTYDDDHSSTTSLGSIFVLDTWYDRIVCEYTGRPNLAKEFYEKCYRILVFYNAICNYENNWKGFFAYMSNKNALRYLCDTPEILKSMEYVKQPLYGNKSKGTPATKAINSYARRLQADWLMSPLTYPSEEEKDKGLLNLHKVRSVGYLLELSKWTIDGNFDRISAMGMLMILREDRINIDTRNVDTEDDNLDYLNKIYKIGFDSYRKRNFYKKAF